METLKTGVLTGAVQVMVTCIVGYGFARFRFPGKKIWFALVLFVLIVPMQTIMSGYYLQMHTFKPFGLGSGISLLGTYWTFWLPALFGFGLRSSIYIYLYRQFFRGQPRELEEAATVDGCGTFGIFWRIMLPGATSIIITAFLFALVWQWNDNYMASYFQVHNKTTLAISLQALPNSLPRLEIQSGKDTGRVVYNTYTMVSMIQAGCLLMILPVLVIYIVLQRYFTESISRSGIVG
nr:carbohydrate ABC transporter permease [bacterium]